MTVKKVAIVTGSNRGIGYYTVKNLMLKYRQQFNDDDFHVILCSRKIDDSIEAVKSLQENYGIEPKYHQLTIDDEVSVNNLKNFLIQNYQGLDVLVNNAAISYPASCKEPSFYEQAKHTINVNYHSTANLCNLLFPILKQHGRVVNVTSQLGMLNRLKSLQLKEKFLNPNLTKEDLDNLALEYLDDISKDNRLQKGWPYPYGVSKILLNSLTFLQQKLFDCHTQKDLVVNAVHPGHCATKLNNYTGKMSPDDGSMSSVFAAMIDPHGKPRGSFIWHDCSVIDWTSDVVK